MLREALSPAVPDLVPASVPSDDFELPRITLRQLVYFAAAARHGSALHAATALNISPPAISGAIASLESLLGDRLFVRRHARGLVLTDAGHDLLAEARTIIGHVREVEWNRVGRARRTKRQIALGCLGDIAPTLLPPLVRAFADEQPGADVRWITDGHPQLMTRLEEGSLDLIFVLDFEIAPTLHATVLDAAPVMCALPASHPLAARREVDLAALADEPFVLLDIPRTRDYFLSVFDEFGLRPRIAHRASSAEMVRSLVAHGFGYSLLNFASSGQKDVVYRPVAGHAGRSNLVAVRQGRHASARLLESFVACAQGVLRERAVGLTLV